MGTFFWQVGFLIPLQHGVCIPHIGQALHFLHVGFVQFSGSHGPTNVRLALQLLFSAVRHLFQKPISAIYVTEVFATAVLMRFKGSFFTIPPRVSLMPCITINAFRSICSTSLVRRFTSRRVITVKIISLSPSEVPRLPKPRLPE